MVMVLHAEFGWDSAIRGYNCCRGEREWLHLESEQSFTLASTTSVSGRTQTIGQSEISIKSDTCCQMKCELLQCLPQHHIKQY